MDTLFSRVLAILFSVFLLVPGGVFASLPQSQLILPGCVQPSDGLIGWWPGDGSAEDIWGDNDGRRIGGTTFGIGKVDQAFMFDGGNDYVTVVRQIQDDFTIEAWISSTQTSRSGTQFYDGRGIVYADTAGHTYDFGTSILNRGFAFGTGPNDTTIWSTTPVNTGAWFHVAAVRTKSTGSIAVYVNGVLENSTDTANTGSLTNTPEIAFGANALDSLYFRGLIDEISVYTRTLTLAEIRAIYDAGSAGKCKPDIYVASINPFYQLTEEQYRVGAIFSIIDERNNPIRAANATVNVTVPNGRTATVQTNTNRDGRFWLAFPTSQLGTYTFCVANLSKSGRVYDPSLNVETCDSITIP